MRERSLFNEKWYFHEGDIEMKQPPNKGQSYSSAKTERYLGGPASISYPDLPEHFLSEGGSREITLERWDLVSLPHDYIFPQELDEKANNSWGFRHYGPAWYRKHFVIPKEDRNKRIVLYFEGIADHADVYFNGCEMYHSFQSNTAFEVELTDFIRFDMDNVLAIRVESGTGEGWWYQGGGIYRNVWLEKYDALSFDRYGVYAAPVLKNADPDAPMLNGLWSVPVELDVRNDNYTQKRVRTEVRILSADGEECAFTEGKLTVGARETGSLKLMLSVDHPELWDIDDPKLYTVEAKLFDRAEETDCLTVQTGFRTIELRPEDGCYLNGRNIRINGVCGHGDYGLTGKAVADSVYRYKAKLLKEMGTTAYRCSHYPQSEYWMDEMDRKGILVMAEVRWFSSTPEGVHELRTLIRRDRNHPCVFLWSVGNEEPFFITDQGARIARHLYAEARKLDANRPIITANDRQPDMATVYDYSDIVGINYNLGIYETVHKQYPNRAFLSTECCASGTTRGWYDESVPEMGYTTAYDHDANSYFLGREHSWRFFKERPWIMGGMQWTGFEYLGEAAWPRICSNSGGIDLYLQKKDSFYQNLALWDEKNPMVHLLPHWNWEQRPGRTVNVWAYTNCDEVELFVNGESQGRQKIELCGHGEWQVKYVPGVIEAVAYKDGKEAARDRKETTGKPAALKLIPDNADDITAGDQLLLTCVAVDREGRIVPDACPTVQFYTNGAGTIVGTGSDNTDHVPARIPVRKMFMGAVSVDVQTAADGGKLVVYANAEGLLSAEYEIGL